MTKSVDALQQVLGYSFSDPALLRCAVTHRSAGSNNNERLEFLGDAVLGMVIAEQLYRTFPQAREGELSRLRATLVKKPALAGLARELGLGEYLRLGPGELKSGGFRRDSILADALEAIAGAIYLDGGFDAVRRWLLGLYQSLLADLPGLGELKAPKSRLQEFLQSRRQALPEYEIVAVTGRSHDQVFEVVCRVGEGTHQTTGRGSSRRAAEQQAAEDMLALLQAGDGDA